MAIEGVGEIVVYVLTAAQAVAAGVVLAVASGGRHRSSLYIVGVLIVGVTVVMGFILGSNAPWAGPILAVVASVTRILAGAAFLGSDPAMRPEQFGRRVVLTLSRRPRSSDLVQKTN